MQWRRRLFFHAERGAWDLPLVRELYKWTRNDVHSEVPVGRMFVKLGMKFAEMACRKPVALCLPLPCDPSLPFQAAVHS